MTIFWTKDSYIEIISPNYRYKVNIDFHPDKPCEVVINDLKANDHDNSNDSTAISARPMDPGPNRAN